MLTNLSFAILVYLESSFLEPLLEPACQDSTCNNERSDQGSDGATFKPEFLSLCSFGVAVDIARIKLVGPCISLIFFLDLHRSVRVFGSLNSPQQISKPDLIIGDF